MKAFITVIGHDTVGVVAKVAGLCTELNIKWKQNQILAVDAMRELNLTKPTFYRLVKRYEGKD